MKFCRRPLQLFTYFFHAAFLFLLFVFVLPLRFFQLFDMALQRLQRFLMSGNHRFQISLFAFSSQLALV